MRVKLLSDLHMEGCNFRYEYNQEDILILAGDIHTQYRHNEILNQIPEQVKILFVPGNHEYYGCQFEPVNDYLKELEVEYPNFQLLMNESVELGDIQFFGGTMFTDFELYGITEAWFVKNAAKDMIADFEYIKHNGRKWTSTDHVEQFRIFERELACWLKLTEGKKRVVISHFMPTEQLTNPKFANSKLNPYFTCDMERYMGWEGHWVCGHGHNSADIMIGDTRVIMNPRGYGTENRSGFNKNLIIEI